MTPYYTTPDGAVTLCHGDSLAVLRTLPDASCDALVTDPPGAISFMGRAWDSDRGGRAHWIAWLAEILTECRRVLKPGAHALVWAIPRTSHWTATAVEDAGFEVRDVLVHLTASGFPKSRNIGKELDAWQGWGTALKPAAEHWILARAPLAAPTIAQNVATHGTGALNIDGSRIGTAPLSQHGRNRDSFGFTSPELSGRSWAGRWPANVVLSCCDATPPCAECPVAELDRQSGESRRSGGGRHNGDKYGGGYAAPGVDLIGFGDSGGASRFYFIAKPSRAEREAWLDDMPVHTAGELTGRKEGSAGLDNPRAGAGRTSTRPALRLRTDLTDEQQAYVLAELREAGVHVD